MDTYANKVMDFLDSNAIIPYRLFRQHCTLLRGNFVKNLSQLGRDLKDVIIVDNSPLCYALQPCNGIPITTWIDDMSDCELEKLTPILELLSKVDDVRDYLREVVRDNELDYIEAMKLLKGEISLDDIQKNPSEYWTKKKKRTLAPKYAQSNKNVIKASHSKKDLNEDTKPSAVPNYMKQSKMKKNDSCAILPTAIIDSTENLGKQEIRNLGGKESTAQIEENKKETYMITSKKSDNHKLSHTSSMKELSSQGSGMGLDSNTTIKKSTFYNKGDSGAIKLKNSDLRKYSNITASGKKLEIISGSTSIRKCTYGNNYETPTNSYHGPTHFSNYYNQSKFGIRHTPSSSFSGNKFSLRPSSSYGYY